MKPITIGRRAIGLAAGPAYIIAEMSANHGQDKAKAKEMVHAMKESGADAVKLQTYTPDTITINCHNSYFTDCLKGTIWEGQSLYELYGDAFTPWEWQPELKELAEHLGMDCFSTPFDETAVDFLERMDVPAYKVASFELVHLPLIRRIAKTGKPMILSTGMATKAEIGDALAEAGRAGAREMALLKCTSAYPAKPEDANLRTIPDMMREFGVPVGISDHTTGDAVPVAAITQGACIIEKHFVLDRERDKGPDSSFSMEPLEFRKMVDVVRAAENDPGSAEIDGKALGTVRYGPANGDKGNLIFRPSVFVVENMRKGDTFTERNTRIIRPGYGLPPKELENVLGRKATSAISRGTPLSWALVANIGILHP
ncbi:pseudaminic acid synthase [Candidatus Peregrinibacteria bacterium]|nr:pseudaminic acid synthase [Candidatus Peregrinibacteria bacterium]